MVRLVSAASAASFLRRGPGWRGRIAGASPAVRGRSWKAGLLVASFVACALAGVDVAARPRLADDPTIATIRAVELPPEGRATLAAIEAGGPFVSPRDGGVFGNRELELPRRSRGYYAEYTVPTPGARNRGARRIIAGRGATGDFRTSGEYYYTNDHYASFRRIVQ